VDIEANAVYLSVKVKDVKDPTKTHTPIICAPLEDVEAVWRAHNTWYLRLHGAIRTKFEGAGSYSIFYMSGCS
jgi:hypothetical protein